MAIYTAPKVDMANSQTEMALIWYQQNRKLGCGLLITSNTYAVVVYNYICFKISPFAEKMNSKPSHLKSSLLPPRSSFPQTMIPSLPNLRPLAIIIAVPP